LFTPEGKLVATLSVAAKEAWGKTEVMLSYQVILAYSQQYGQAAARWV
jgi:hypothetical protein